MLHDVVGPAVIATLEPGELITTLELRRASSGRPIGATRRPRTLIELSGKHAKPRERPTLNAAAFLGL
jgi:hypothetical protein